jgi:hypothetical protein
MRTKKAADGRVARTVIAPAADAIVQGTSAQGTFAATGTFPWVVVFCLLSILWLTLLWFPVARMSGQFTTTINEGFATYQQTTAARGDKVYGSPPKYVYQNYPPLSFHLVGWLGLLTHDTNVAGRWISFVAYLAIALFVALIVEHFTHSRQIGAFAALCWLIWLAAFDMVRVGYNDPHVLGVALSLAGLYWFVRDSESIRGLCISAVLFSLSLFTKQSLVAFPCAVGIQLFLTSRRRFAAWLGASVLACVILLALTIAFDGRYFMDHLMMPRPYDRWGILDSLAPYLQFAQVGFVVALIWALRQTALAPTAVLVWSFAIGHVVAAAYCGGAGASVNHFYEGMIATSAIVGLGVPELQRVSAGWRFPRAMFVVLLVVPFFLTSMLAVPPRIYSDLKRYREMPKWEAEFAFVKENVSLHEGPAICETLLICYAAGKAEEYDPYTADMAFRTGRIRQEQLIELIASRHFRVIQLEWPYPEPIQPAPRVRFTGPVMRTMLATYQVAARTDKYVVLTPR